MPSRYKPIKPKSQESDLLKVARIASISLAILGVLLVPIFQQFKSIYSAHGAFTAAITPPLVVTLLLGVFWKKFTPNAAKLTMIGGSLIIFGSILYPEWITPFAHGVPMKEVNADEFLAPSAWLESDRAPPRVWWKRIGMTMGGINESKETRRPEPAQSNHTARVLRKRSHRQQTRDRADGRSRTQEQPVGGFKLH